MRPLLLCAVLVDCGVLNACGATVKRPTAIPAGTAVVATPPPALPATLTPQPLLSQAQFCEEHNRNSARPLPANWPALTLIPAAPKQDEAFTIFGDGFPAGTYEFGITIPRADGGGTLLGSAAVGQDGTFRAAAVQPEKAGGCWLVSASKDRNYWYFTPAFVVP